jgi:hypothetical protein
MRETIVARRSPSGDRTCDLRPDGRRSIAQVLASGPLALVAIGRVAFVAVRP